MEETKYRNKNRRAIPGENKPPTWRPVFTVLLIPQLESSLASRYQGLGYKIVRKKNKR